MIHILMGVPLAAGLVLALCAQRFNWAPPLPVALGIGAGLRLVIVVLAVRDTAQPYDLAVDFPAAADAVLGGHDPLLYLSGGRWHFLPLMAYVLAGQRQAGHLLGLEWSIAGRIVPALADIALIPLVGRLAGERQRLRAFQYACAPLALMISAIHGQFPPLSLVFGVAALLAARRGRAHPAGVLAGLVVTSTSWTALLLPGILLTVPALRQRLTVLGWTAAVPAAFVVSSSVFLATPPHRLPAVAAGALTARPVAGDWGWSALVTGGNEVLSPALAHIGTPMLVIGLLMAGWWWRRSRPVDLTQVLLLVFVILTYRFGTQYLLWPVPYLIARPTRGTWPALTAAGIWAGAAYLHVIAWPGGHQWWATSSLLIIALLIRALPPHRPAASHTRAPDRPRTDADRGSGALTRGQHPGRAEPLRPRLSAARRAVRRAAHAAARVNWAACKRA